MPLCLADLATISSFCLWCSLIAGCLGSQCTSSVSYPPSEEMSLCASRQVRLTKLAILPDNNCTCRLTINLHDRVRIAAKLDSSQPPDCSREAFVICNLATLVNIRQLCEMGTCEELGSQTERSVYVISYRSELASAKTSLRLWLEAVADPGSASVSPEFGLECGYPAPRGYPDVARFAYQTTAYWSASRSDAVDETIYTASTVVRRYPTSNPTTTTSTTSTTSTTTTTTTSPTTSTTTSTTTTSTTTQTTTSTTKATPTSNDTTNSEVEDPGTNMSMGDIFSYVSYWNAIFKSENLVIVIGVALAATVVMIVVIAAVMFFLKRRKAKKNMTTEPSENCMDIFIQGTADNQANQISEANMFDDNATDYSDDTVAPPSDK